MSLNVLGPFLLVALTMTIFSSAQSECTTDSECPSDSCCVLQPMRYAIPTCVPMQRVDEMCRPTDPKITANLTYPNDKRLEVKDIHYIMCPCVEGSFCNTEKGGVCT